MGAYQNVPTWARERDCLPWGGKGEMLTQVERISKTIIIAAGLRPELTFTSFGRHGGTTEASTSSLTETQLRPSRMRRSSASSGASRQPKSERLSE